MARPKYAPSIVGVRMGNVVDLLRETARWAWVREEVQGTTSGRKVLYFIVLYGGWFAVMIVAGVVLQLAGYTAAASAIWVFGIGFSAFMASIDIAWEAMSYLFERRDQRAETTSADGPPRELARDLRPARDTWVGFVVTVAALLVLFGLYGLFLALSSALS